MLSANGVSDVSIPLLMC